MSATPKPSNVRTLHPLPDGVDLLLAAGRLTDHASMRRQEALELERAGNDDDAAEVRDLADRYAAVARWLTELA